MKYLIYIALYCLLANQSIAQQKAIIDYVSDGDTFYVHYFSGEKTIVRLAEVDCPEKKQEYGLEVKEIVANLLQKGDTVKLYITSKDRYGRTIAAVSFNDQDLATYLVVNGLAWHYKQYSNSKELERLELEAKESKTGLWKNSQAQAPWVFRRGQ